MTIKTRIKRLSNASDRIDVTNNLRTNAISARVAKINGYYRRTTATTTRFKSIIGIFLVSLVAINEVYIDLIGLIHTDQIQYSTSKVCCTNVLSKDELLKRSLLLDPTRSLFSEYLLNLTKPSTDNLGVLQCVARLPTKSDSTPAISPTKVHLEDNDKHQTPAASNYSSQSGAPPSSAHYPQVVVLPASQPLEEEDEADEYDEPHPAPSPPHEEVASVEAGEEVGAPMMVADDEPIDHSLSGPPHQTTYTDEAPSVEGDEEDEKLNEESQRDYDEVSPGGDDNQQYNSSSSSSPRRRRPQRPREKGTLWKHLRLPKLTSIIPGRLNNKTTSSSSSAHHQRRVKRQSSTITTIDGVIQTNNRPPSILGPLAMIVARTLMEARQQRQLQLQQQPLQDPVNFLQQLALGAVSNILGQGIDDIPIRMANMGQLLSSLITVLTINNPMIMNEPILMRARLASQTPGQEQGPLAAPTTGSRDSPLLRALETLMRNIQTAANQPQAGAEFPAGPTLQSAANETLQTSRSTMSNSTATELISEIDFVNRLNSLTVGQTTTPVGMNNNNTMRMPRDNGAKFIKPRRTRKKRSIGTMLMFGPFSKYYMALMMHKLVKQQSSIVSQTIMSELVRRLVIPGVASALTGQPAASLTTYGQLLNQARQAFKQVGSQLTAATTSVTPQVSDLGNQNPADSTSIKLEQQLAAAAVDGEHHHSPIDLDSFKSKGGTLTADCHFVDQQGSLQGASETLSFNAQQLMRMMMLPTNLLASAMTNNQLLIPSMSLDQQGLSINLPMTQRSLTMPNLFTGAGQQALMRLLARRGSLLAPDSDGGHEQHASSSLHKLLLPRRPHHSAARGNRFGPHQHGHMLKHPKRRPPDHQHPHPPVGSSPYDWLLKQAHKSPSHDGDDHQHHHHEDHHDGDKQHQQHLADLLLNQLSSQSDHQQQQHRVPVGIDEDLSSQMQLLEMLAKMNGSETGPMMAGMSMLGSGEQMMSLDQAPKADSSNKTATTIQQIHALLSSLAPITGQPQLITTTTNETSPRKEPTSAPSASDQHQTAKLDSVDMIADRLLNETLTVWLKNMMSSGGQAKASEMPSNQSQQQQQQQQYQPPPDLKLAKEASDHLAQSMGLLLKEIEGLNSMSEQQSRSNMDSKRLDDKMSMTGSSRIEMIQTDDLTDRISSPTSPTETPPQPQPQLAPAPMMMMINKVDEVPPQRNISRPVGSPAAIAPSPAAGSLLNVPLTTSRPKPVPAVNLRREQENGGNLSESARPVHSTTSAPTKSPKTTTKPKTAPARQPKQPSITTNTTSTAMATKKSNEMSTKRLSVQIPTTSMKPSPKPALGVNNTIDKQIRNRDEAEQTPKSAKTDDLMSQQQQQQPQQPQQQQQQQQQHRDNNGQPLNNLAMALNVMNMVLLNRKLTNGINSTDNKPTMSPTDSSSETLEQLRLQQLMAKEDLEESPKSTRVKLKKKKKRVHSKGRRKSRRKTIYMSKTTNTTVNSPENHRTSTNSIRLHANLISLTSSTTTSTTTTRPPQLMSGNLVEMPNYLFKPLVTVTNNATDSSKRTATNDDRNPKPNQAGETEISDADHAARWNDVLQHLALAS